MKTRILILLLAASTSINAQKPIKIVGTIDDPSTTHLYIQVGKEGSYGLYNPEQEIEVKNGKFQFQTKLSQVVPAWLKRESGDEAHVMATIYLVPSERLNLTIKSGKCICAGSKVYKEMNEAEQFYSEKRELFDSWYDSALARYYSASETDKPTINQEITDSAEIKYGALTKAVADYRKQNLASDGVLIYLSDHDDVEMMYSDLLAKDDNSSNPDFPQSHRVGAYLSSRIKHIIAMRRYEEQQDSIEQAKLDAMRGTPAPDFTLTDITGNPLTLSSLRGKYVILDFWGSWCGWCIKGIPDMKKYYEKYAGKFEILGIDCRDTEEKWKAAVAKYELPWLHVYNPASSSVCSDFDITGYPTKIVIDPDGNIAKVIIGEDPAFYTYLDELFGKE